MITICFNASTSSFFEIHCSLDIGVPTTDPRSRLEDIRTPGLCALVSQCRLEWERCNQAPYDHRPYLNDCGARRVLLRSKRLLVVPLPTPTIPLPLYWYMLFDLLQDYDMAQPGRRAIRRQHTYIEVYLLRIFTNIDVLDVQDMWWFCGLRPKRSLCGFQSHLDWADIDESTVTGPHPTPLSRGKSLNAGISISNESAGCRTYTGNSTAGAAKFALCLVLFTMIVPCVDNLRINKSGSERHDVAARLKI